jgi:hypothetical protein
MVALRVAASVEIVATTADADGTFERASQYVTVAFVRHCPFP